MKRWKSVGMVVILLGWQLTCEALPEAFQRVGGQGQVDFILVDAQLAKEPQKLKFAAKQYADAHRKDWCKLLIWSDKGKVATRLPMTDAQLNGQVAEYSRNAASGLDRFRTMKNGCVTSEI